MAQQQQPYTRGEGWQTFPVPCTGGLVLNEDALEQAMKKPGSALQLINYEPSLEGGYRRILGYTKFDTSALTGSGAVLGSFIFNDKVVAQRGTIVSVGTGSGWTVINGVDVRTAAVKCIAAKFEWDKRYIVVVDGGSGLKPYMYDSTNTYTSLTNAPSSQTFVAEFKRYLWFCDGTEVITFSAPGAPNDYNAINGAGAINVGMGVTGMAAWRDELYLFNNKTIKKISGTSSTNWTVSPVAENLGCLNPFTIQELGGDVVFRADDGIRNIAGTAFINDRDLNNISRPIMKLASELPHTDLTSVVIRDKNQYRLIHSTETSQGDQGIIGVNQTGTVSANTAAQWEWSTTSGLKMSCANSGIYNNEHKAVMGDWSGFVYSLENGDTFNGTGITSVWQTPYLVFTDPDIRKTIYKLCAFLKCEGDLTIRVGVVLDYSNPSIPQPPGSSVAISGGSVFFDSGDPIIFDVGSITFDAITTQKPCCNLNGSGFSFSFVFSSQAEDANASHIIQSTTIQFREAAKR